MVLRLHPWFITSFLGGLPLTTGGLDVKETVSRLFWPLMETVSCPRAKGLLLPEFLNARVSRMGISSWSVRRAAEIFLFMHWVQTVARATHRAIDYMNATP